MITALGRSDLTPDTWELVRNDLREAASLGSSHTFSPSL